MRESAVPSAALRAPAHSLLSETREVCVVAVLVVQLLLLLLPPDCEGFESLSKALTYKKQFANEAGIMANQRDVKEVAKAKHIDNAKFRTFRR